MNDTVYELFRPSRCHGCDKKLPAGAIVKLLDQADDREAYCVDCSHLQSFVLVQSGNAQLTRLAGKYSDVKITVMKWSDMWKCYERRGIMVRAEALTRAQSELKK